MNVSDIITPHVKNSPEKNAILFEGPFEVEFLNEIPRLASGKALRRQLREKGKAQGSGRKA